MSICMFSVLNATISGTRLFYQECSVSSRCVSDVCVCLIKITRRSDVIYIKQFRLNEDKNGVLSQFYQAKCSWVVYLLLFVTTYCM